MDSNSSESQQHAEVKRGKSWGRNHRYKEKKRARRLKTMADQAIINNGAPTPKVTEKEGEATLPEVLNKDQNSELKGINLENLEMQQRSPCSPSTIRMPNEDMLAEVHKAFERVDNLFSVGSAGEAKDTQFFGELATGSADSPTCAEANAMGGGPWPADSKRKRGSVPDASKKAKVVTFSECVGMETSSALPTSTANHESQAPSTSAISIASQPPLWAPEYFVGGNPRMGPLRAEQSAFTGEVAVGLMYGSRLPADKAVFAQCKDAWELYTHVAKCLAGLIGATTELHNRATSQGPATIETDSRVIRLERELASKNLELEDVSKRFKKQAEKIANQARYLDGLASNYQSVKTKLAERDEQCKMINAKYVGVCERNKVLCSQYNQLQREKEEQENAHSSEITQEMPLAIQSSDCVATGSFMENDEEAMRVGCSTEVNDIATGECIVFSGIDPLTTAVIIKEEHTHC